MIKVEGHNINEIISQICVVLIKDGILSSPRNLKTLELLNVWCTLSNPEKNICTLPERKLSHKYLNAELEWYKSGDLSIKKIKNYSSMWSKIADNKGYINSNYGYWAKHHIIESSHTQFEWCYDQLKKDPNSRRAIINYNNPDHKVKDIKDFPCTISQQFYIRNNALDSVVLMRSNDLIYGFCYDVPWFTLLQKQLSVALKIKLGNYNHYAMSMHVYEKHFDMITKIVNSCL